MEFSMFTPPVPILVKGTLKFTPIMPIHFNGTLGFTPLIPILIKGILISHHQYQFLPVEL
jgi:hypothetical protein